VVAAPGQYNYKVIAYYPVAGQPEVEGDMASVPSAVVDVPVWRGRYRLSLVGFHVNKETWDNALELDGKGDEIFVTVDLQEMTPNGAAAAPVSFRSAVYGDVNGYPSRIRAGSRSSLGGLKTGDDAPVSPAWAPGVTPIRADAFPITLWEGELVEGERGVLVVPAVWEQDAQPPFVTWFSGLSGQTGQMLQSFSSSIPTLVRQAGPVAQWVFGLGQGFLLRTSQGIVDEVRNSVVGELEFVTQVLPSMVDNPPFSLLTTAVTDITGQAKDRPVGMTERNGAYVYNPQILQFNVGTAEAYLRWPTPAPGVIELKYYDASALGGGSYSLFFRVERLP
jgi:hypothetical protein